MPTSDVNRGEPVDPLVDAVGQVGDRWSLLVIDGLLSGPRRFGELLEDVDGLAPNILSKRLKQLEADGLIVAEPYSRRPLRHSYRLTAAGEELAGVLRMLTQWAASRRPPGSQLPATLTHAACGSALEARWYCPTCDQVVDHDHTDDVRWL